MKLEASETALQVSEAHKIGHEHIGLSSQFDSIITEGPISQGVAKARPDDFRKKLTRMDQKSQDGLVLCYFP